MKRETLGWGWGNREHKSHPHPIHELRCLRCCSLQLFSLHMICRHPGSCILSQLTHLQSNELMEWRTSLSEDKAVSAQAISNGMLKVNIKPRLAASWVGLLTSVPLSHHLDNKVTALNNNFKEGRKLVFNDQSITMVI